MKNKIIIIGAGAWGTALASLLAQNNGANFDVCLIANKQEIADEINQSKTNHKFLPNINLSYNLKSSQKLEDEALQADYIFVVTPSNVTLDLLKKIATLKIKENCGLVVCSKGLDSASLKFFHQIVEEFLPQKNYAILSGPNFAAEVANGVPTITTIASKNKNFAAEIVKLLENKNFKAEISENVLAAEICGIVKNVMAIGCGIVDELALGQNAKAALVMQGVGEIEALCQKFGYPSAINNSAGFGDIFLTCASTKSRNNSLGALIVKGEAPEKLLNQGKTYEGAIGAKAINKLAREFSLKLPLCSAIDEILQNNFSAAQIKEKLVLAILS